MSLPKLGTKVKFAFETPQFSDEDVSKSVSGEGVIESKITGGWFIVRVNAIKTLRVHHSEMKRLKVA